MHSVISFQLLNLIRKFDKAQDLLDTNNIYKVKDIKPRAN